MTQEELEQKAREYALSNVDGILLGMTPQRVIELQNYVFIELYNKYYQEYIDNHSKEVN